MAKTFNEVTEKLRENLLKEFDELDILKSKDALTENDLDYFLARDRKAGLIMKTLDMDMKKKLIELRHKKQIGNKSE